MPLPCSQAGGPKGGDFVPYLRSQGTKRALTSSPGGEVRGRSSWQWWPREEVGVDRIRRPPQQCTLPSSLPSGFLPGVTVENHIHDTNWGRRAGDDDVLRARGGQFLLRSPVGSAGRGLAWLGRRPRSGPTFGRGVPVVAFCPCSAVHIDVPRSALSKAGPERTFGVVFAPSHPSRPCHISSGDFCWPLSPGQVQADSCGSRGHGRGVTWRCLPSFLLCPTPRLYF